MDGLKVSDEALMVLNYTHVHELWESRFVAVGTYSEMVAVPERVPGPPHLPSPVLQTVQHALGPWSTCRNWRRQKAQELEVLLCLLLRDHQPVKLAHIAWCHPLVEQGLPRHCRRDKNDEASRRYACYGG